MKLIIDISENLYNFVNTKRPNGCYNNFDEFDCCNISKCIRNGIILPKGHGRLIDEKEVYKKFYCRCLAGVATEVLEETSTIIEADIGE